jgi:hypothetical protein
VIHAKNSASAAAYACLVFFGGECGEDRTNQQLGRGAAGQAPVPSGSCSERQP